jgi:hypothetical protein
MPDHIAVVGDRRTLQSRLLGLQANDQRAAQLCCVCRGSSMRFRGDVRLI